MPAKRTWRSWPWAWVFTLTVATVLGIVLALIFARLESGVHVRDPPHAEIVALQAGLDEANERLAEQGEPPVPVPDVDPGEDPQEPVIIVGERGFTGATGPQGRTGPPGEIGPRGPLGPRGEKGDVGDPGAIGATGADGRGIQSMQCATGGWVIEYTDGFVGSDPAPCRGIDGTDGTDGEDGTDGKNGTATPGDYACPDGEVMVGFSVAEDGAVTLACKDTTPPVLDTP